MIRTTALATCLCSLALAAPALGATRYAAPDGTGVACTPADPCHILTATTGASVADGDTAILLNAPGLDYELNPSSVGIVIDDAITVRGERDQPRPTILAPASGGWPAAIQVTVPGVVVEHLRVRATDRRALDLGTPGTIAGPAGPVAGSVVRDVYLEATNPGSNTAVYFKGNSTLERAEIQRRGTSAGDALWLDDGALARDSFVTRNSQGTGEGINTLGTSGAEVRIRNLTVFGSSVGIFAREGPYNVSVRNSLIDGGSVDISAIGDSGAKSVTVTHSNLNPSQVNEDLPDGAINLVPPNQNQAVDIPMLVNPTAFDFHQLAGSPTRNAGSPDAFTGSLDIDGQPRTMGTAIDIGGDEFFEQPPPPTGDPTGNPQPSNQFTLGKLKRKKKKGIAFLFIDLPGPGELGLAGKGVKAIDRAIAGGRVKLKIAPAKKGKKGKRLRARLLDKGKAKLKVRVTYVPTGGTANTRTKKVKLIRK